MRAWYWLKGRCHAARARYWRLHLDAAEHRKAKRRVKRTVR